jgi:uncharacterized protein (TIGR02246 family)
MTKTMWPVIGVLTVLAGCARTAPPTGTGDDVDAIRSGTANWVEAYNAGDVDKLVAHYADDAVLMPPGAAPVSGREAIKQYFAADITASKAAGESFVLDPDSVGVSGDSAWHAGEFHDKGPDGSSKDAGKFVELWRRVNGNWVIVRDIWNDNAPAVAATSAAPLPAVAPAPANK